MASVDTAEATLSPSETEAARDAPEDEARADSSRNAGVAQDPDQDLDAPHDQGAAFAAAAPRKLSPARIAGRTLIGLVVLIAVVLIAFDAWIRVTYDEFYDQATPELSIPGINSGFVPQDIDYLDEAGLWLFSGYSGGDLPSPIWRLDAEGNSSRIGAAYPDGTIYTEHGGGITSAGPYVFLTCKGGYLVLAASDVATAKGGTKVQALAKVDVGFDPAFINVQDDTLYTGVFFMEGTYPTPEEMHIETPDGTLNHAVMYAYPADATTRFGFAETPRAVYSIPDKVQGTCRTPAGDIMLSTSWGFAPSHLLTYRDTPEEAGSYDVNGVAVPLFCLDAHSLVSSREAPPMAEGILLHEDKVFVSFESACNKYIFGKLYGGGTIYSMAM